MFDTIRYHVTVLANDIRMGIVTGEGDYAVNSNITINATPNQGYRFLHWSDGIKENLRMFTVISDTLFTATFEVITAIADIDVPEINVFPNPAIDNVYISLPENMQATFTLYDMQGKALIYQQVKNRETVSVNHLATGVYIYNIRTNKENYTGKIIKK
jgi:hypothetical protein